MRRRAVRLAVFQLVSAVRPGQLKEALPIAVAPLAIEYATAMPSNRPKSGSEFRWPSWEEASPGFRLHGDWTSWGSGISLF